MNQTIANAVEAIPPVHISSAETALPAVHGGPYGEIAVRWTAAWPPDAFSLRSPSERFAEAISEARHIAVLLEEIRLHEEAARRHQRTARDLPRGAI